MQTVPARPPRDVRLDIVRGWLQLSIFASHAHGSFIGGWLIHAAWGLSDSSELFVFLSGFTLGSVFARRESGGGWRAGTVDLLGWNFLFAHSRRAVPAALVMLYQPADMGILPVFVWCMLLLPGFAVALRRWGGVAMALPVACYAAVWLFGLGLPSLDPDGEIAFNPFAWQILFLGGAWLGRRALLGGQALNLPLPALRVVLAAALAVLAAGLVMRLTWYGFAPWPAPFGELYWIEGKQDLAVPRLAHALALAFVVAALVPRDAAWMHRAVPRAVARIGQYSLEVFCLGLFLSWGATAVFRLLPAQGAGFVAQDVLLTGAGSAALAGFADWLEHRRRGRRFTARP